MRLGLESERELEKLYDDLARVQWWRRRLKNSEPGEGFEMHKALEAPTGDGPAGGTRDVNEWLWKKLRPDADLRALDIGCGFGASLFSLAQHAPSARLAGLSLSGYQVRVAIREAERLKLSERLRFHHQSFDTFQGESKFDLLLSIETLFHAPNLKETLLQLASLLAPAGRIALLEDMAVDESVASSQDARELLRLWSTERLYTRDDYRRALESAGLRVIEEFDLTAQVPSRGSDQLIVSSRRLKRLRAWMPTAGLRRMIDAFLGGLHLEELYGSGRMNYRCLIASASDA